MSRVEQIWERYWSVRSKGMPPEISAQMPEIKRAFMAGMHSAFYALISDAAKPDFQATRQLQIYLTDLEDFMLRETLK